MCFSAIMALLAFFTIDQMTPAHPEIAKNTAAVERFIAIAAVVQTGVGILGLFSGINFLKLKSWSRKVLEVLTWLLFLFVVGFGIYWVYSWASITREHTTDAFDIMGAVMGVVITAFYAIPVGIMLVYLRGEKVKSAMIGLPVTRRSS